MTSSGGENQPEGGRDGQYEYFNHDNCHCVILDALAFLSF